MNIANMEKSFSTSAFKGSTQLEIVFFDALQILLPEGTAGIEKIKRSFSSGNFLMERKNS